MKKERIKDYVNEKLQLNCESFVETMCELNKMFNHYIEKFDDMQLAFDALNVKIGNNVLADNFTYSPSDGGDWCVEVRTMPNEVFDIFKGKDNSIDTIEDLVSYITKQLMNTMSNVGCDVKTAFEIEKEDFPIMEETEDYIVLLIPEGTPCLEYMED